MNLDAKSQTDTQTAEIQNTWYKLRDRYQLLAEELHRLLDEDERFPRGSVYTVKHRLKSERRLIQKIEDLNSRQEHTKSPITASTFQDHIADLLGIRIICLRLSDLKKVQEYISSLQAENSILVLEGPVQKETFLLRPGKELHPESNVDLQYSGYSSIHYIVKLGPSVKPPKDLSGTRAELQVRTILEEAWGEIDHRYRYELKRAGSAIPSSVESGFRDLALYLQAAARHAEHLCEEVDRVMQESETQASTMTPIVPSAAATASTPSESPLPPKEVLRKKLGFEPTPRTLAYLLRRIDEHAKRNPALRLSPDSLQGILNDSTIQEFVSVYKETLDRMPFSDTDLQERESDLVALMNFALYSTAFPMDMVKDRLRHVIITTRPLLKPGQQSLKLTSED
jgi:putative GTP pyrophosphokinase